MMSMWPSGENLTASGAEDWDLKAMRRDRCAGTASSCEASCGKVPRKMSKWVLERDLRDGLEEEAEDCGCDDDADDDPALSFIQSSS